MTLTDIPNILQSSQSFVRSLKSAKDPPYEEGPSKIQIARLGWDSQTLYIPRKADLLLEWILSRFHKEKLKKSLENPLIDAAHWSLLADILAHPGDAHVVPLVTRASIPGLLSSFFVLYPLVPDSSRDSLFSPMLRSLNVLWPLAIQRASIDALSECLWTSLSVSNQIRDNLDCNKLADVLVLVFTAFRSAFDNANAAGKKKAYLALVQHQLHSWLRAMHSLPSTHPLHTQLYSLGVEILFNPDSIRASLETNSNANTSTNVFSVLFSSSIKPDGNSRTIFLNILPHLAKSYYAALRKHRSTIYPGSQSGQQGRSRLQYAALRFGSACLVFLKTSEDDASRTVPIWTARLGVLTVIEEQAVFDSTGNDVIADEVRTVVSEAIKTLDRAWDKSHFDLVTHALDALACLHRIEPDILTPVTPQIIERLITCSVTASHSAIILLSQLISYHSKTRTLHTFISLLLVSATSAFSLLPPSDAQTMYDSVAHSPILSLSFSDELSASLRTFMTPGQAEAIVDSTHTALESSIPSLDQSGESSQKRRKLSVSEDVNMHNEGQKKSIAYNIVELAFVARLCATTLTAVLHITTKGGAVQRRKACLDRIDSLISGALEASFNSKKNGARKSSKKDKGKRAQNEEESDEQWCRECFSSTLLRLWYDLFARSGSPGTESDGDNIWEAPRILDRLHDDLIGYMRDGDAQPELQLEIGRVLYARGASLQQDEDNGKNKWAAFDAILDYVQSGLSVEGSTVPLSAGKQSAIFTRKAAALVLWSMTLERYLVAVDMHASPTQLERLADLIIHTRSSPHDQMSGGFVLARAMASASFWEYNNVRMSLLTAIDKQTVDLASCDIQKWLSALAREDSKAIKALSKTNNNVRDDLEASLEVYRLLRYFPLDYLPRTSRMELAKRALAADVSMRVLFRQDELSLATLAEWQAVLRSFVVMVATQTQTRIFDETASIEGWMPYLTLSKHAPPSHDQMFVSATLGLLSLIYLSGMRSASSPEGKEGFLANILSYFTQSNPFSDNGKQGERLAQRSIVLFIRTLVREFKVSSFSTSVLGLFRSLCTELDSSLKPAIGATATQADAYEFLQSGHIIEAWQVLLSFKQWLSIQPGADAFGEMMLKNTSRIISSANGPDVSEEFRANILSLIIQQGYILQEMECGHIKTVAAAYILFTKSARANVVSVPLCDKVVAQAIKTLSVPQFEAFLDLVAEAMECSPKERPELELEPLLHLWKLLLREAPERTSKISHESAARCLRVFVNRSVFTKGSPILSAQVLDFIHSQCIERAASLKTSDTVCIWTILSSLLVGSDEHDDHTSASIFQTIVSIVNALVRLRRDLIAPHLPQLSMILRQFISAIRGVRPLLGTKQHHLVSDKLPKWINPQEPLGEDDARVLARVLTALTTKSLIRSHSSDSQKAESLARPFARHAPYVLLAYIQLMNDPLSVLSITTRRELEPGLFALCSMMGEHGRDTLMAQSLDVGGKALLKTLWKEYDKQKYVGGG